MDPTDNKPLTPTQRANHYYMVDAMTRFEWDMHHKIATVGRIPNLWHEISQRREHAKVRITLGVDADVVKWFKSMGPRYQPRMNDVLRSFMHAKLMGLLKGDDMMDMYREAPGLTEKRPEWGDIGALLKQMKEG